MAGGFDIRKNRIFDRIMAKRSVIKLLMHGTLDLIHVEAFQ